MKFVEVLLLERKSFAVRVASNAAKLPRRFIGGWHKVSLKT
jgi:hypothetical protein